MIIEHVSSVDVYSEIKAEYGKEFIEQLECYEDFERGYALERGYIEAEFESYYDPSDLELELYLQTGDDSSWVVQKEFVQWA